MVFETKKIDPARAGETVRRRREELRFEIRDISRELKIPAHYLEWIEEGSYDRLPAPFYVKAFFKKYAQFLKLDPAPLLEELERELAVRDTVFHHSSQSFSKTGKRRYSSPGLTLITPVGIRISVMAIFFLFMFGYFIFQLDFVIRSPEITVLEPPDTISSTQMETLSLHGKTNTGVRLTLNGKDVYVDGEGNFRETIMLREGMNTITLEASTRFSKKSEKTLTIFREKPSGEPEAATGTEG